MNRSLEEEKEEQRIVDKRSYRDLEQRVAARTKELAALNAIAAAVSQSLHLDEVLNGALEKTLQVMEIEAGGIYLLDEEAGVLTIAAHRGFSPEFVAGIDKLKVGEGFSGRVAQSGQPLLVENASTDPRLARMVVRDAGLRSAAIVPLSSKGKVLGTLFAMARVHREFSKQDVQLLTSIGHQIGVAIENARLYEDTKSRLAQLTALQETTRAVASTLQLDELLNLIIEQASALVQAGGGILNLVDWEKREDEVVSATGSAAVALGYSSTLEGSLSGWVTLHNRPVISNHVQDDPRVDPSALSWLTKTEIQSAAVVPLAIRDHVLGTLVMVDKEGGRVAFSQGDSDLLVSFASQAATAIENARLFDAEARRAEQFRVIGDVGRSMTSVLAIDDLLHEIVRLVKETFGYYLVQIGLIEGDEMVFNVGLGPTFDDPQFQPPRVKVGGEGITAWVAATGEPLLVPDVSQDPRYLLLPGWGEIKSELAVPLKTKSAIIGTLDVESNELNAFDESDLVVLQSLANQAAAAIENARLYEQAQQAAALEERNRLARELHDSAKQQALAASFQLGTAITLFDRDPQAARQHLTEADNLVDSVRRELTDLIHELRPPTISEGDFAETLNEYAVEWAHQSGVDVDVKVQGRDELALEVEQTLYRIMQEALANVARHSSAGRVDVALSYDTDAVTLTITDDGCGFDTSKQYDGMGLRSMGERTASLNGDFAVESSPGQGTRVSVTFRIS
jgi:GAF domain-containing protein/anti-sigma regulatory factor (Ser/Thr protein kinase)